MFACELYPFIFESLSFCDIPKPNSERTEGRKVKKWTKNLSTSDERVDSIEGKYCNKNQELVGYLEREAIQFPPPGKSLQHQKKSTVEARKLQVSLGKTYAQLHVIHSIELWSPPETQASVAAEKSKLSQKKLSKNLCFVNFSEVCDAIHILEHPD